MMAFDEQSLSHLACSAKSASDVFAVCQATLHAHEARRVPEEGRHRRVIKFADLGWMMNSANEAECQKR